MRNHPRIRKILTAAAVAIVFALTGCSTLVGADSVPKAPPLTRPIVDETKTLSSDQIDALATKINDGRTSKSRQVGILVIDHVPGGDLEGYSIKVARAWGVGEGKTNNGVFILVATDDHKLRLEVGTGLEGDIPDAVARRIGDNLMVPRMKDNDLNGALTAAVGAIYSDAPALSSKYTYVVNPGEGNGWWDIGKVIGGILTVLFILFVLVGIFGGGGRGGGGRGRGGRAGYVGGYYGGSSYSSGSSSSSSSGGSFGGGGFSGGGSSSSW